LRGQHGPWSAGPGPVARCFRRKAGAARLVRRHARDRRPTAIRLPPL